MDFKIKTESKQDTKHRKPTNKFAPPNIGKPFVHMCNNNNNKQKLQTKSLPVFFRVEIVKTTFFYKNVKKNSFSYQDVKIKQTIS